VSLETRLGSPYRGIATDRQLLRIHVSIASPAREIVLEVDDASVEVSHPDGGFVVGAIDQLFVVERPPPAGRFLTWFGVFARRRGQADRMLIETPESHVARFVERAIETRLGLADERVRGELRL
jgi:hypothetical protein